VAYVLKLKHT